MSRALHASNGSCDRIQLRSRLDSRIQVPPRHVVPCLLLPEGVAGAAIGRTAGISIAELNERP